MKYSKQTIDKIKEVYPVRKDLVERAEKGDPSLRLILDELAHEVITPRDIVNAFESTRKEDLRNLYDRARIAVKKEEVYDLAMEDMYQSFSPENLNDGEQSESNE